MPPRHWGPVREGIRIGQAALALQGEGKGGGIREKRAVIRSGETAPTTATPYQVLLEQASVFLSRQAHTVVAIFLPVHN